MDPCIFTVREKRRKHKPTERVLTDFTLSEIANLITEGKAKNIVVLAGAGISVAAGIPDFRSPGTGVYAQLQKYDLADPSCIFHIDYFQANPEPFYVVAKSMLQEPYDPTDAHLFVKLLQEKGVLLRHYTQNVDGLERGAGIDANSLVECHGTYATAHTLKKAGKRKEVPMESFKERLFSGETRIVDEGTNSLIKPDVVFFGEDLPVRFFKLKKTDFKQCDLLIVMGTSLNVYPFADLPKLVPRKCPRLLLNNQLVGDFDYNPVDNARDVCVLGDIQESVNKFVELLGWEKEFSEIKKRFPNRRCTEALGMLPEFESLSLKNETSKTTLK